MARIGIRGYGGVVGGWQLDKDGMLAIPDAPGLGVTLDMDAVAKRVAVAAISKSRGARGADWNPRLHQV